MSDYDAASRIVVGKVLADEVKLGLDELKIRLLHHMRTGDRIVGEHENVRLGAITKCEGRKKAQVVDPTAFLGYVEDNYPDEVYKAVRSAFSEVLLDDMLHHGCDRRTGAVVPGVAVREGAPYLSVRATPEGKEWIRQQLGQAIQAIGAS